MIFNMLSEHILAGMESNGHFIEALLSWYSVGGSLKDAHGCALILATVGSESNTRVRLATFIIYRWASHLNPWASAHWL